MCKKLAIWLFPDLVSRDLLDSANELLLQRINESKQLRSQLHSEETDKNRFRDDLNKTSVQLDATINDLAVVSVNHESTKTRFNELISQVQFALKKRIVAHNPKHTLRTVVDRQNAILDEISNAIGPTQKP